MSDYQLLLERVRWLYEKHEAGRRKPFNVFSALRSKSDEVNLHSRFLHALLDYRKSPEAERENLKDFLQHVGKEEFEEKGVKVYREYSDIDILITNDAKQAVAIENKIWAGDQPKQLQRYYKKLRNWGYSDIHLLYLTPYGDEPSEDSAGDLDYKTISYKDDLPPWLECCQQRADDEPALRESVAQYRQLVRKLTGTDTDLTEAYMSELKELLLQNNNFVLARTLIKARTEVHIELLKELWDEIESEMKKLKNKIRDLPEKGSDSDISLERIENLLRYETTGQPPGLYYPFGRSEAASLGVGVDSNIYFGVRCSKREYQEMYNKLREALEGVIGDPPDNDWPWCKYVNEELNLKDPTQEHLELLSNADARKNYAQEIACGLSKVWETIEGAGLA